MKSFLRLLTALVAGLAIHGTFVGQAAVAQAYPSKPIRINVGFAAGASTDQLARVIAAKLAQQVGQPVIVENRAGAGGAIASEATAKAAPDGYTLLLGEPGGMAIAPSMIKGLTYDPVKDFAPIGQVISITVLLVAHPSLGAKKLADLKALSGGKPLPYGSAGPGTMQHLAVEQLKKATGLPLEHVPYKGGAPALNDLLGGQIPLLVITAGTIVPHVKAGKVVPLVVLNASRSRFFPDVPTAKESGYPDFAVDGWQGFFSPAGTPREIVTRLNGEIRKIMEMPDVVQTLVAAGNEIITGTPEAFGKQVREDGARWGKVVRELGLSPN
jgi:tripartite-type tricarboxylate transporter receptor subunit TctC